MKTPIRSCTSVVLAISFASLGGFQSVAASISPRPSATDGRRIEFMAKSGEVRLTVSGPGETVRRERPSRPMHPKLAAAIARLEKEGFVPRADLVEARLRAAIAKVPASTDPTIERLRRSVELADAMTESQSPQERVEVLARFGVAVKRHASEDRAIAPPRHRLRHVEQPDGGASSISPRDDLDDAIAAADADADPAFDSAMSYADAVIDEMDAQIAYIESETWEWSEMSESEANCPVPSGPSEDPGTVADCWSQAAEAVLASYGVKELASYGKDALQAARTAFNSAKAAAAAGYAAATLSMTEAVGMVTTALGAFLATTTGQVIVVGSASYLAASYGWELLSCMGWVI